MQKNKHIHLKPSEQTPVSTEIDCISKYKEIRKVSEVLCQALEIEDYIPQVAEFVSPPKWNLGHTTWFFEEMILKTYVPNYKEYNPIYAYLFNSYYQSVGDKVRRNSRGNLSRPTVKEVFAYRKHIDKLMLEFLSSKFSKPDALRVVEIGLNHEQQHQELFLSDIKYTFSTNPLYPKYCDVVFAEKHTPTRPGFISIEEGTYEVGNSGLGFAYDNEIPKHKTYIQGFDISSRLVSNAEYIYFIESGGYTNFKYWHDEAWSWIKNNGIIHPLYWRKIDNTWYQYTLAGLRPIINEHPVTHVNYYEAFAYAQWRNMRLPTEFEWEVASPKIKWGDRWEWTESAHLPYPGYKKPDGALGEYNGKFMVNQKILRGASVATPHGHIERNTYRNFYHPHIGYQFNGIRLAK